MPTQRHIILLRGINVGGIRIKMADLRDVLKSAGFSSVATILASGNAVVTADETLSEDQVKARIESALRDAFDYDAWVVVISPTHLNHVIDAYPFDEDAPDIQPYVLFSSDPETLTELIDLSKEHSHDQERIEPGQNVLYWEVPRGQSTKSPFARLTAKKRYKATTTTRNMRTLRKILAKA